MLISTKGETDGNIMITGGLNTPLTPMGRLSRLKINKQACTLYDTLEQINLVAIYQTFYSKAAENTFFSSAHRTFSKIDHNLSHKSRLGKVKNTETISSIFSDHNTMRLEINYRGKKTVKTQTRGDQIMCY